jgi:hypothetical protein
MSDLEVSLMKEEDIDGAIATVQQAFAEDPYNKWIYNVRENVTFTYMISTSLHQTIIRQDKQLITTVLTNS